MLAALLAAGLAGAAAAADRAPYLVDASSASAVLCRRESGVDSCEISGAPALRLPGPSQPVTFAAFGDSGKGTSAQGRVAAQLEKADPHLVLLMGDIVYPSGQDERYDDLYYRFYAKLAARRPFFPAVGNHDYGNTRFTDRGLSRFKSGYARVFRRPPYYSFDAGPVHFVSLDTNEAFGIGAAARIGEGSEQRAWLERDLAASQAAWKVVFLHVPLYASAGHGNSAMLRRSLVPVFRKHGVDLVLAGHDHVYERWKPVDGFLHIIAGTGGAGLYTSEPEASGLAKDVLRHGFVLATADAASMSLRFVDDEGKTADEVVLRK